MTELQRILQRLDALSTTDGSSGVLATLVTVAGSSYRRPGARLLCLPDGHRIGSISGGCLEEDVLARAARVAATGVAELATYDTTAENDLVWGVGLGCHGVVQILLEKLPPTAPAWSKVLASRLRAHRPTPLAVVWRAPDPRALGTYLADELPTLSSAAGIFFETVEPPTRLIVYGAGDDAQPLVRLAKELGWHVTVADPRAAFATAERFPTADAIVAAPAPALVARTAPAGDALAVVMTHHYVHDVPLLRDLLPRPLAYLGLLGPKQRAERILADLAENGLSLTPADRARLHAPVGLDLGAENPEDVALSILAEMRATLAGRDARPLRERRKPIHA
jgi:xanthine/CO dehydrogenase XdhC/CoxF family maturation factor